MLMRVLIPLTFLVLIETFAMPVIIAEPPKEVSTNEAGSLVNPMMSKKPGTFQMPLTAEHVNYRRGPMTRHAVYDPVKNVTHIWDINRGSYDLPGDHTRKRKRRGGHRRTQDH